MYNEQIERIQNKLGKAREKDCFFRVFGASHHKYKIGKVLSLDEIMLFEEKFSVKLPDCYKAFLMNIGNGGISINRSAAGPYYGIYPLGVRKLMR